MAQDKRCLCATCSWVRTFQYDSLKWSMQHQHTLSIKHILLTCCFCMCKNPIWFLCSSVIFLDVVASLLKFLCSLFQFNTTCRRWPEFCFGSSHVSCWRYSWEIFSIGFACWWRECSACLSGVFFTIFLDYFGDRKQFHIAKTCQLEISGISTYFKWHS